MDKSEIAMKLQNMISEGRSQVPGGRRRAKRGGVKEKHRAMYDELVEADPIAWKNQYIDDDSSEYIKTEMDVIKHLAIRLFGDNNPSYKPTSQDLKAVPEKLISKTIKELKDQRDSQIDQALENLEYADEAKDYVAKTAKALKYKKALDKEYEKYKNRAEVDKLKHPEWEIADKFKSGEPITKNKAKIEAAEGLLAVGYGKKKRAPSAYNKFVKEFAKKYNGGSLMKDAAKAWNRMH